MQMPRVWFYHEAESLQLEYCMFTYNAEKVQMKFSLECDMFWFSPTLSGTVKAAEMFM